MTIIDNTVMATKVALAGIAVAAVAAVGAIGFVGGRASVVPPTPPVPLYSQVTTAASVLVESLNEHNEISNLEAPPQYQSYTTTPAGGYRFLFELDWYDGSSQTVALTLAKDGTPKSLESVHRTAAPKDDA